MSDPTDEEVADVRRRIVEAAWELGCAEGEPAVTMRRIAERVGISATGLYTHFYDKAALVRELLVLADERLAAVLAEPLDDTQPIDELLHCLCTRHLEFIRAHGWLFATAPPTKSASVPLADSSAFVKRVRSLLCERRACDETEGLVHACRLRIAIEGLAWAATRAARASADAAPEWGPFADGYVRYLVRAI